MMMAACEHNATIVCLTKDSEAGFVAMQLHSAQDSRCSTCDAYWLTIFRTLHEP
jgi:hypothetical protein